MKRESRAMKCRYCGAEWTITGQPDDLRYYLNCCAACYANDEPGMARFERMRDMMGVAFALEHA